MATDRIPTIRAQAIAWHVRLRDGRDDDWEEFTDWLALDPQHSLAYDAIALGDRDLDEALSLWARSTTRLANDNAQAIEPSRMHRRWILGGAAAAAAATLLLVTPMLRPQTDYYDMATAPGEQRVISLAGRDRIALNGETRIRLDKNNPRFASLAYGEAAFTIRHDPKLPFVLHLGESRVVDVGTKFNVIRNPTGHIVEVAEGSILYNPAGERIALAAGQTLTSKSSERQIILSRKPPSEVGGWQRGRLSYRSRPLAIVAADISRSLGTPIVVEPAIASRLFTGTIEIDRNESRMFARLAKLLDVDARRGASGWTLGTVQGATH